MLVRPQRCWSIISHDVTKSVGCHNVVKARNESGKGEADILNDTRTLYTEQQGSSFIFEDNKDRNTALLTQMKRKNDVIEELLTMDLFKMDPDSEESKPFFTFIRTKRLAAMMQNRAIEVSSSRRNERDISDVDNAEDDATGGARSLGKPSTCVTNGEMTTENEGLEALDVSHTLL
ncbi:hypothetical protein JG688_00018677 [Phytophthora aleatoria]|uniref:Uncharacterized protein n=1 Tax=Phytophthora aleatoria TaxID=2496075 RepID=A0A8J5MAY0_9STRA|nr:hypothetical protein JG688_00018677 [Phytophthora aleatoria]